MAQVDTVSRPCSVLDDTNHSIISRNINIAIISHYHLKIASLLP
jgi:hypothetical protein